MDAAIYGLASTKNGVIRYVGETSLDFATRANHHYRASGNSVECVRRWAMFQRWQGYDIYSVLIERCHPVLRWDREKYWSYRVPNKINERNNRYFDYLLTKQDKNHIECIQYQGRRTFQENWNGFIGIRYYPEYNAWQTRVQAYNGKYLQAQGDGGPVEMMLLTYRGGFGHIRYTGDRYFSDPNYALKARQQVRAQISGERRRKILLGTPQAKLLWPRDRNFDELD